MKLIWSLLGAVYKFLAVIFGITSAALLVSVALDSSTSFSAAIPAALMGGMSYFLWNRSKPSVNRNQNLELECENLRDETISFINEINEDREFPPAGSKKIISTPSRTVVFSCDAELNELKARKINKKTTLKLSKTESGELNITDRQLLFISSTRSVTLSISSITSIDTYMNGFTVYTTGRAKPITFTVGNGFLCATLVRSVIDGKIEGNRLKAGEQLSMA